jgi:hypothetical protein
VGDPRGACRQRLEFSNCNSGLRIGAQHSNFVEMRADLFVGFLGGLVLVSGVLGASGTSDSKPGSIRLTYLGNAGYKIDNGKTILLVDPYLTQFKPGGVGPTDFNDKSDPVLEPDTGEINKHISRTDFILITHSHSDHLLDAPYIATKR